MNKVISLGVHELKPITHTDVIKIKIIENKVTQSELAKEFGVTKQTFNGWITGRITPSLITALRIAKRLNCRVEDLWEYEEDEKCGN